jgi:hypothetical protein
VAVVVVVVEAASPDVRECRTSRRPSVATVTTGRFANLNLQVQIYKGTRQRENALKLFAIFIHHG